MTCPRSPPVKSLAIEPPHCTRDYPAAPPNLPLHMLGGGQPRSTSPASPLFSQATLKTACVSPGPLRCNHQGGVKHAKIFMPMGRTNWKGAQNAGEQENSCWKFGIGEGAIGWIFYLAWSREMAGLCWGAHGNSCYGAWSVLEIFVL